MLLGTFLVSTSDMLMLNKSDKLMLKSGKPNGCYPEPPLLSLKQGCHVKKKDMWELLNGVGQSLQQGREKSFISLLAILVTIFVITCRVYLQKKTCRV